MSSFLKLFLVALVEAAEEAVPGIVQSVFNRLTSEKSFAYQRDAHALLSEVGVTDRIPEDKNEPLIVLIPAPEKVVPAPTLEAHDTLTEKKEDAAAKNKELVARQEDEKNSPVVKKA